MSIPMKPAERDLTKLPIWAQRMIETLRRDVECYQAWMRTGPEDSDTFANPYSSSPTPLGRSPVVEFRLSDQRGDRIRVHVSDDVLHIHGGDRILVVPQAANAIIIRTERL